MNASAQAARLHERLRASGPSLGSLAGAALVPGLDGAHAAALCVDRATRDRLVIFDPPSAPLLRPLVAAADVALWHRTSAGRWIVAVPRGRAAEIERHPALARHLSALSAPAGAGGDPWWALADEQAAPALAPRLIIAGAPPVVAWDDSAAMVGGPAAVVASADPYWLGLLGSRVGRAMLAAPQPVAAFPVPEAPGPARAGLAGLALSAAALASQIAELRGAVLRRLVADFGPPGVAPGPILSRWWELDFAQLHQAVRAELRNDIPERFRATWAQIHADEQAAHAAAAARLAALEAAVDAQALAAYGLSAAEAAALGL